MGEVVTFRSRSPVIYVDGADGCGFYVNVRPCPNGIESLRRFPTADEAAEYAAALNTAWGWQIIIAGGCPLYGAHLDGAA